MKPALTNFAKYAYWLLLTVWTAIFAGFWSVIFLGGEILQWLLVNVLGANVVSTDAMIQLLQHVSGFGLALIWAMGAFALYVAKRLMWAAVEGPGGPYNIDLVNDGKVIDGSAIDKTERH